jgi:hypothetical protein
VLKHAYGVGQRVFESEPILLTNSPKLYENSEHLITGLLLFDPYRHIHGIHPYILQSERWKGRTMMKLV